MRKTFMFLVLALTAAACDGGPGGDRTARPDELRLAIVRGKQQTAQVIAPSPSLAPGEAAQLPADVLPEAVVVRISTVASSSVGTSPTGPSFLAIPAGAIMNWRVIGEGCGTPYAGVTAADGADSVVNFWRKGSRAGVECRMVAEGVSGGAPFGSDTAVATFTPGAASPTFWFQAPNCTSPCTLPETAVVDAHGNAVPYRIVGDSLLTVAGDVPGSVDARTVSFSTPAFDMPDNTVELRGADGGLVGRMRYRIGGGDGMLRAVTAGVSRAP